MSCSCVRAHTYPHFNTSQNERATAALIGRLRGRLEIEKDTYRADTQLFHGLAPVINSRLEDIVEEKHAAQYNYIRHQKAGKLNSST